MRRREFIQRTLGGALTLAAASTPGLTLAQEVPPAPGGKRSPNSSSPATDKLRGVNLGGWLVLEKWMVPDVYRGTDAADEYNLCLTLGDKAQERLDHHRETFITAADFKWIKNCGLNAVRLPVG